MRQGWFVQFYSLTVSWFRTVPPTRTHKAGWRLGGHKNGTTRSNKKENPTTQTTQTMHGQDVETFGRVWETRLAGKSCPTGCCLGCRSLNFLFLNLVGLVPQPHKLAGLWILAYYYAIARRPRPQRTTRGRSWESLLLPTSDNSANSSLVFAVCPTKLLHPDDACLCAAGFSFALSLSLSLSLSLCAIRFLPIPKSMSVSVSHLTPPLVSHCFASVLCWVA